MGNNIGLRGDTTYKHGEVKKKRIGETIEKRLDSKNHHRLLKTVRIVANEAEESK